MSGIVFESERVVVGSREECSRRMREWLLEAEELAELAEMAEQAALSEANASALQEVSRWSR